MVGKVIWVGSQYVTLKDCGEKNTPKSQEILTTNSRTHAGRLVKLYKIAQGSIFVTAVKHRKLVAEISTLLHHRHPE